jgi:hypothetical protein
MRFCIGEYAALGFRGYPIAPTAFRVEIPNQSAGGYPRQLRGDE